MEGEGEEATQYHKDARRKESIGSISPSIGGAGPEGLYVCLGLLQKRDSIVHLEFIEPVTALMLAARMQRKLSLASGQKVTDTLLLRATVCKALLSA